MALPVEFRVPISPTVSFYRRTHLFCAALRRLGKPYAEATVHVVVGDEPDLSDVRKANAWAEGYPVEWHAVPSGIFQEHHYFGTADFRYLIPSPRDGIVILMDADAVVVNPVLETLEWMKQDAPALAGHMAHSPPPVQRGGAKIPDDEIWPFLFNAFGIPWPATLYSYSIDIGHRWAKIPAYYKLGFVALNRPALKIFRETIFELQHQLKSIIESGMRCQIACTLTSYLHGMQHQNLPATFNTANAVPYVRISPR